MRRVATIKKAEDARLLFSCLIDLKIDCKLDEDENEGFTIWVVGEDEVSLASEIVEEFLEKGEEALIARKKKFQEENPQPKKQERQIREEGEEDSQSSDRHLEDVVLTEAKPPIKISYFGGITRIILIICAILFFVSTYQTSDLVKSKKIESTLPILTPINQALLYDYPVVLQAIEKLFDIQQSQETGSVLDKDGDKAAEGEVDSDKTPYQRDPTDREKVLIEEIEAQPLWVGVYNLLLHYDKREVLLKAPLFTSIKKGEVWRIFTPMFLHAGLLHFIFNMLWLWLLGKMVEGNMRTVAFISFVLLAAAVTNTCQYLMTGPFFMGISGVISALAGYVWSRKKVAPWEVYPIDRATLIFLACFIFGLLALQIVAFYLQLVHNTSIGLNFANTAHVSGVFLGLLLGRTKLFQRKI